MFNNAARLGRFHASRSPGDLGGLDVGRKSDWLVSMTTFSGPFSSDVIRIGGSVECDSMSLLGRGAGNSESAAKSSTSNAPPTHRK